MIARLLRRLAFKRQLEKNLRARKQARLNGQTYVAGYVRKRANACGTALSQQAVEPASPSRPFGLQSLSHEGGK